MPVVNRTAVEFAIKIGLALNCEIAEWCRFARKNYFYPDMPKNFQTSQYDEPIAFNGYLDVDVEGGETVRIEIERAHMEEDTGKSLHVGGATGRIHGAEYSLLDYNRAGVPLVEIVTRHHPRHQGEGAGGGPGVCGRSARPVARVGRVRRADGSGFAALRRQPVADAGRQPGARDPHRDQERQLAAIGGTRGPARDLPAGGDSRRRRPDQAGDPALRGGERDHPPGRSKETAEDYRYFPEPDLVPIAPPREWVEELRAGLPEMPWIRRARLQKDWGFTDLEMRDLIAADAVELVERDRRSRGDPRRGEVVVVGVPGREGERGRGQSGRPVDHAGPGGGDLRAGRRRAR